MQISKHTTRKEMASIPEQDPRQGKGCSHGGTFVLQEDIPAIAKLVSMNTPNFITTYLVPIELFHTKHYRTKTKKGHHSPCIFYDEHHKACTINQAKPLYCSITNTDAAEEAHQWYLINYVVNTHDPSSIREWKAYADTILVIPGGKPEELVGPDLLKKILSFDEFRLKPPIPPLPMAKTKKIIPAGQRTAARRTYHGKNNRH